MSMRVLSLLSIMALTSWFASRVEAQADVKKSGGASSPAASGTHPEVAGPLDHLKERIEAICANKSLSYQRLLHDASHVVRDAALDQPWDKVEAALDRQQVRQLSKWAKQHTRHYEYLVDRNAWIAGDGTAHSLYLTFMVDARKPQIVPIARPGQVMVAAAGLRAEPNRSYEAVLKSKTYPERSVVHVGLRLPEVAGAARAYSIVKRIEVTYDFIRDRWAENVEQGFFLDVTLGTSVLDDREGNQKSFSAPSGLDSPQSWKGEPIDKAFEPHDTIGDFRSWGGMRWKSTK
jgi:hypothetical protein